jgi:hypothetical protein
MPLADILLYVQSTYGLALEKRTALTLARKFSLLNEKDMLSKEGSRYAIQLGPFLEAFESSYYPDIPDGWKSVFYLMNTYKLSRVTLFNWIRGQKVKSMKFHVGTMEVYFAKESEVKRYIGQRRDRICTPGAGRGNILGAKAFKVNRNQGKRRVLGQ